MTYYDSDSDDDEGVHFEPDDDELINEHLIPMLKGEYAYGDYIVTKEDVYAKEPWLLNHTNNTLFKENEWYYFVTRTQVSEKKIDSGKKAKRKIGGDSDCWSWNQPGKKEDITDKKTGKIIGTKRTFTCDKNTKTEKKQKREDGAASCAIVPGSDSRWFMTEYRLQELKGDQFQKLVLCKIREIKNKKSVSRLAQHPTNIGHESVLSSSCSQLQPMNRAHRRDMEIPLACLRPEEEAEEEETYFAEWLESDLLEQDDEVLIYNTRPWIDQDLLDQYASLYPTKVLKK